MALCSEINRSEREAYYSPLSCLTLLMRLSILRFVFMWHLKLRHLRSWQCDFFLRAFSHVVVSWRLSVENMFSSEMAFAAVRVLGEIIILKIKNDRKCKKSIWDRKWILKIKLGLIPWHRSRDNDLDVLASWLRVFTVTYIVKLDAITTKVVTLSHEKEPLVRGNVSCRLC